MYKPCIICENRTLRLPDSEMITCFLLILFTGKNVGSCVVWSSTSWQRSLLIHLRCLQPCPTWCPKCLIQVGLDPRKHYMLLRTLCVGTGVSPALSPDQFHLSTPGVTHWVPSLLPEHQLEEPRDIIFLGPRSCTVCLEWILMSENPERSGFQPCLHQVSTVTVTLGYFLNWLFHL